MNALKSVSLTSANLSRSYRLHSKRFYYSDPCDGFIEPFGDVFERDQHASGIPFEFLAEGEERINRQRKHDHSNQREGEVSIETLGI